MMRTVEQKKAIKPGEDRKPVVCAQIRKAEPCFRGHPIVNTVLTLQRTAGNQVFQQTALSNYLQRQGAVVDYFTNPGQAFQRYSGSKARLARELKAINRIANKAQKRIKQGLFLKKILDTVIRYNPFTVIAIKNFQTNDNAVTEWVDDNDHSKGIQVLFNELVLTDPLESIILTGLHESVHGRQLKSGVPYRAYGRAAYKDYLDTMRVLSELDAYTMEVQSPFFQKLSQGRQKHLKGLVQKYAAQVKAGFQKMDTFRHKQLGYQSKLKNLLSKFSAIQGWLKQNPPPW